MIVNELKSHHNKEVTKLGGTIYDKSGYRMDVNLWFRHKNEALFYLDSVGKVHGPMDQTYSIRLGPVQKTGKEIAFKREFNEEIEIDKWRSCKEFQSAKPMEFCEQSKHIETVLRDVSSNNTNNYQKSFLTTATHIIPKPTTVTLDNHSTTITKQSTLSRPGVTVNLTAPIETIEETTIRERRLVDELLEARNELNTLRRAKSVADTSQLNDNSENYYNEKFVSKVVTDVQPTIEKLRSRHLSTRQEYQQKPDWDFRDSSVPRVQIRPHQSNHHLSEETSQETFIKEKQTAPVSTYSARKENMKSQQMLDERNLGSRTLQGERSMGQRNEMTEEIETITLQPIGKGVQDLSAPPSATFSRPASRSATPRGFDSGVGTSRSNYFQEERRHVGNYNTMPAMPKFGKTNSVRNVNQSYNYDLGDTAKRATISVRGANDHGHNNISYNRVVNEQTIQGGSSNKANEHLLSAASNRATNGQTMNTSWHTRTETTRGGNHGYTSPMSPMSPVSNQESMMSNVVVTSAGDDQRYSLQWVLNTEEQWYQPHFSREDVINSLRDKEAGSFYIRNSSTFAGAFGLGLKVAALPQNVVKTNDPQGDLVRHFLIETVDDASGNGVRLKGFTNELVYPSLAHLVQAHCQNAIALPTRLVLPQASFARMDYEDGTVAKTQYQYESHQRQQQMGTSRAQLLSQSHRSMSSPGVNFLTMDHSNPLHQSFMTTVIYLGKVDVDRLTGYEAIQNAVDKIMAKGAVKTSTVEIQLDSTKGITLNDKMQKLFYTRQFSVQHVLFAGFDPKHRECPNHLLQNSRNGGRRIIGIVIRKQKMILRENVVHLFCEIDDSNSINDVLAFISENYLRRM